MTAYRHHHDRMRSYRRRWAEAGLTAAKMLPLEAVFLRQRSHDEPTTASLEVLAEDIGRSRGAVQEALKALEVAGWIVSTPAGRRGQKRARMVVTPDDDRAAVVVPVVVPDRHRRPAQSPAQSPAQFPAQSPAQFPAQVARDSRAKLRGIAAHIGTEGQVRDNAARAAEPVDSSPDFAAMRAKLPGHRPVDPLEGIRAEMERSDPAAAATLKPAP